MKWAFKRICRNAQTPLNENHRNYFKIPISRLSFVFMCVCQERLLSAKARSSRKSFLKFELYDKSKWSTISHSIDCDVSLIVICFSQAVDKTWIL